LNFLYLSHVPWQWIKQRPHFIAEQLSKTFNLNFAYQKIYSSKNNLTKNTVSFNLKLKEVYRIPFSRFNIIKEINRIIFFIYLKISFFNIDVLWFTSPEYSKVIKYFSNTKIIYDCMDDVLEFPLIKNNLKEYENQKKLEKELFSKSNIVFTSSERLKHKLIERYGYKENIYVINNALNIYDKTHNNSYKYESDKIKITYIGTISEWFDFTLIIKSLEEFSNIEYLLFGPKDIEIPANERIKYLGVIEHEKISSIMELSDVLIMPFELNELILSVDPVKAYEYISSNKIVILPEYDETLKFKDYCYLYKSENEFISLLKDIINNKKFNSKNQFNTEAFVKENSWDKRVELINKILLEKL
jgi:teichuronic acid biosynthesis glycosyltransferase TuaH